MTGEVRPRVPFWIRALVAVGVLGILVLLYRLLPPAFPDLHVRIVNAGTGSVTSVVVDAKPVRGATQRIQRAVLAPGEGVDLRLPDGDCRVNVRWSDGLNTWSSTYAVDPLPGDHWRIDLCADGRLNGQLIPSQN